MNQIESFFQMCGATDSEREHVMNHLQDSGSISDNAVHIADIADGDASAVFTSARDHLKQLRAKK